MTKRDNKSMDEYRSALQRLRKNNPKVVPKGSKINKDTVALEAGRKRGSIKKSRPAFASLIEQIEEAASKQNSALSKANLKAEKNVSKAKNFEALYKESLNRELMLLHKIAKLERGGD